MSDALDGFVPEPAPYRRDGGHPASRGKKVALAIAGAAILIGATVAILESLGVEVWPRHASTWQRHAVRTLPDGTGSCDVFYSRHVTPDDARRLAEYLNTNGYFDGDRPVSVFLTRESGEYAVSFFFKWDTFDEREGIPIFERLQAELKREVFENRPVVVNLCDDVVRGGIEPLLTIRRQLR